MAAVCLAASAVACRLGAEACLLAVGAFLLEAGEAFLRAVGVSRRQLRAWRQEELQGRAAEAIFPH